MSVQVLATRESNRIQVDAGSSLSLALDDQNPATRWVCDVFALLPGLAGPRWCGRVTTVAFGVSGAPPSRVVLVATVPGAVGWQVALRRFAGPADAAATAEASVSSCVGGPPGVFAL